VNVDDSPATRAPRRLPSWIIVTIAGLTVWIASVAILVTIGYHVTLPAESVGMAAAGGGIGATAHQLTGKASGTDFLIDYAAAHALTHHDDAYAKSARLTVKVGEPWAVSTADPHPPTFLTLLLPFTLVRYRWAEAAYAAAMIFVLVATIRLLGVRWAFAIGAGVGIAIAFPGAYGISNPVPLIGLGVAIAYRYRDQPWVAGAGLALAAAPKWSGLLLVVPFLFTHRWRAAQVAVGLFAALAVIPIIWQHNVWSRYLKDGLHAISVNANRRDNAAVLHAAKDFGVPSLLAGAALFALTAFAATRARDTWWPTVWLVVAALPVAWMYSTLTLLPIAVVATRRPATWPRAVVLLMAGLISATPQGGPWTRYMYPVVVGLAWLLLFSRPAADESRFWPTLLSASAPRDIDDLPVSA